MNKHILLLIIGAATVVTGCAQRSRQEMWEDTKTCGRYVGKGFRSLLGHHIDPREYAEYSTSWDEPSEFVPLADNEQELTMRDAYPPPTESPGDPGSLIPGIERFITPTGVMAAVFTNVHFETDNYAISGGENLAVLKRIAEHLNDHPRTHVFIEGHADERGAAAYNLALGAKRANSVRTYLIQNGVDPNQLFTISFGKERPLTSGHDELAWKQNRRAQFKLYDR